MYCTEPTKMTGEGEYNLNVLKEIMVTESYLGLDQNTRKCQKVQPLHNCTTRLYIDTTVQKCGCLPFNMRISDEVIFFRIFHLFLAFEWKNKLRFVRIFFDTPTFDRVTRDRAAKPVDMLSAIGGTMGLLTGFSLISGVEIIYFACKIFVNIFIKKCNK